MRNEKTYKCAIIGVGKAEFCGVKGGGHQIGYNHARMIKNNSRCELVAGADINAENLQAFQKKWEVAGGYADYREMLEKEKPDIVSICTYVGLHDEMTRACADAGVKGVFLEKPLLHSPAALGRVNEAVERTGLKICAAHIRRHVPMLCKVREILEAGEIGRPVLFLAGIENWDLSEWGSHWLDIFRFFNSDRRVEWVMAQARVRDQRGYGHAMEDHAVATFEFENKVRGLLDGGKRMGFEDKSAGIEPPTLTIQGTEGIIYVTDWLNKLVIYDAAGRREIVDENDPEVREMFSKTWDPYCRDLVDWLDGKPCPPTGWDNTRGTAELNLASYVSMLRGDRVDLPLDAEALEIDEWPVEILAKRRSGSS